MGSVLTRAPGPSGASRARKFLSSTTFSASARTAPRKARATNAKAATTHLPVRPFGSRFMDTLSTQKSIGRTGLGTRVRRSGPTLHRYERAVRFRPSVPEELPGPPDLLDHVEVAGRDEELVPVLARGREEVASRIDDVRRAIEAPDVPRGLGAHTVRRRHEVAIRDRVSGLLELPEVLREAGDRRGRIEDDLGAVQAQRARALGEVAVITDI